MLQAEATGQTVPASVDCGGARLDGAERETCASPDLIRLTAEVDQLTARLEATLTDRNKEALLDTEKPFRTQRNNCQNAGSGVHECVKQVSQHRLDALSAAVTSPTTILDEAAEYTFLDIPFFVKWGGRLVGKRVHVWGCMVLEPGPVPERRIHGTIRDCSATQGPDIAAIFKAMNETRATWFYDAKKPGGYWEGTVERRDGRLVLAEIEP